jgi:porphobilinogen synthase
MPRATSAIFTSVQNLAVVYSTGWRGDKVALSSRACRRCPGYIRTAHAVFTVALLSRRQIRVTREQQQEIDTMVQSTAPFPLSRLRRPRQSEVLRRLTCEHSLSTADLIWPVFVRDGENARTPVVSMPGVERLSVDLVVRAAEKAARAGIPAICLFPYTDPSLKTEDCAEAWNPDNLTNRAIRAIKAEVPEIAIMTDVALDPYNINGHDGFVEDGKIVNDRTVEALVKMTLAQAEAGADIIGPSDMMDGRIGAMRRALEADGHQDVCILSYSAKYASAFYGPFRDAVGASGALTGDKKTYQMNPGNSDEALRLVERDLSEGADMVMVKPGMPYLDICRRVKDRFAVPTYAYQVSGEYAMIQAAAQNGWVDGDAVMLESLLGFKRSGCDGILTYFAPKVAEFLNN